MSQTDILDWLIEQRRAGHNQYFSFKEIRAAMEERGCSTKNVFVQLRRLEPWLENEMVNLSLRWRVREKYV